jgi:hypothetical protein
VAGRTRDTTVKTMWPELPERLRNCPQAARPPVHWHALSCCLDLSERAACPVAFGSEDLGADLYHNTKPPAPTCRITIGVAEVASEASNLSAARRGRALLSPSRARPRERINGAKRNVSREGEDRAPQAQPRSGVATFSYTREVIAPVSLAVARMMLSAIGSLCCALSTAAERAMDGVKLTT